MKLISYFFLIILTLSCSSKKNILFLQDSISTENYPVNFDANKIKSDDILKIKVSTESPELSAIYNPISNNNNSKDSFLYNGYLVDNSGYIIFPVIGSVYVANLSTNEVSDLIKRLLIDKGLLVNPSIDVKIINSYFTILGEVNNPGRYNFLENNMDILQALGIAGDLTINGQRKNIKLIRNVSGDLKISTLDLTSSKFLTDGTFQIKPGDVIIVNPNSSRIKNAGVIGNSGTLLTLLSFILSSIIVISN